MPEALLAQTNWGKLLEDAQTTLRALNIIDDPNKVIIARRLPSLQQQLAPPYIIVKPSTKTTKGTFNNLIRYDYGLSIACVKEAPSGSTPADLPGELVENQRIWDAFMCQREWATSLDGAMLLSLVENGELNPEETETLGFATQLFRVVCEVEENLN